MVHIIRCRTCREWIDLEKKEALFEDRFKRPMCSNCYDKNNHHKQMIVQDFDTV